MSEIEELYENFPTILKEKLRNKEIEFPSNTTLSNLNILFISFFLLFPFYAA